MNHLQKNKTNKKEIKIFIKFKNHYTGLSG